MTRNTRKDSNPMLLYWFLLLAIISSDSSSVLGLKINSFGGYEDVVITIGNDVPPIICSQLLQTIRDEFTKASDYLHLATDGRVFFQRLVVVLPASWDARSCHTQLPIHYTSASSITNAAVVVGSDHPIFGSLPFTQQSQGCGKPGDFISVGYKFFLQIFQNDSNSNSYETDLFRDRLLVHEWTKYRYGVFEEVGFENDPIYPTSYKSESSTGSAQPNLCSNINVSGRWSDSCQSNNNNGSGGGGDSSSGCSFQLSSNNENVTSSIMSVPSLPQVNSFCNDDNHNHFAPSKHNFLCSGKSIWRVMGAHPDFANTARSRPTRRITPDIVIKQLTPPRFVLVIEETANVNLRDVWKFLKLAIRKFIKYDLETGTQVGMITVNTDSVRVLANMTTLDESVRGTLAEKLPNYPSIESPTSGTLSLRKGVSQAINMLKWNGARVAGSVLILISQGTVSGVDQDAVLNLLKKEEVSIAAIEYPSSGDGRIAALSHATNSPYYSVRETGVGTFSHLSTYIQLVNAMMDIQRYYTRLTSNKIPALIHQEEFKGDAPAFVQSSFYFDSAQSPAQFHIYIPNAIDPKVNVVELMSPSGKKYTDQLSYLHDINVIKIDARIDTPGLWTYRIERLGDSHQSHFVQVVTAGTQQQQQQEVSVRLFSNIDETRVVDYSQTQLILFADVKRGNAPVIGADVVAYINSGDSKWYTRLHDNGNGDPDLTQGDGVYSRYIIPPTFIRGGSLDITVKVSTSPSASKYFDFTPNAGSYSKRPEPCCGSSLVTKAEPNSLKKMPFYERIITSYTVKVMNIRASNAYPPGRIGDLRVIDSLDKNVTFQFTSPGDDYDQGQPLSYELYFDRNRALSRNVSDRLFKTTNTAPAGTIVNFTVPFPNYGLFFVIVHALDPHDQASLRSNVVQVSVVSPFAEGNGGNGLLSGGGSAPNTKPASGKLSKGELAGTIAGVVVFVVLVIALIVLCICLRRRASTKKDVSNTETNVFTISEVKEPMHWSASELLQEHEKRLSMYGQSQRSDNQGGGGGGQLRRNFSNGSPGSSQRSFRSINDGQYRASLDGGRRPTLTDYESCSSDPILKGPVDYDTALDSDTDNLHYRTIDSYVGAMYRANINANINPGFGNNNSASSPAANGGIVSQQTQVQYNSSYRGSLTSVNSKRRNITMV